MPTADRTVGARTNDVYRTVSGVDLDLGPFDRLRGSQASAVNEAPLMNITPASYPRIILKDSLGYELDTYTTLQEAIYRAKWNVRSTGQAKTPLEWRLPKAPPPARPDLTRACPPVKHPQLSRGYGLSHGGYTNILEIDVDDVSFVKESLDHLPFAPSLSFLRQEFLMGPKTYFQIVGTMLLHKKLLSETEKRQAIYNFPGFCTGCVRMGLCYGCERSSEPHYHEDKLVKTGGGFTYYKKDRPEREMKHKHPLNWKINHPDQVLKKLMEDYAGVRIEGEFTEKVKEHLDEDVDENTGQFSDGDILDTDRLNLQYNRGDDGRFLPEIDPRYITEQHRDGSLLGQRSTSGGKGQGRGHGQGQGQGHSGDRSIDPSEVEIELWEDGRRKTLSKKSTQSDMNVDRSQGGMSGLSSTDPNYLHSGMDPRSRDDSGSRHNEHDRYEHRLPKYRKTETDEELDEDEKRRDYEGDDESRGRKRERLYKPPVPFKLKKSPKRRVEAKSPFSTDRSYDIQKGRDFVPKKSGKKPTEFVDFRNVDVSWKEPKKFELKKGPNKTTKFWSGQRKKKKEKSRSRSPRTRRVHSPRPRSVSPDSGLDTGFVTADEKEHSIENGASGDMNHKAEKTYINNIRIKTNPDREAHSTSDTEATYSGNKSKPQRSASSSRPDNFRNSGTHFPRISTPNSVIKAMQSRKGSHDRWMSPVARDTFMTPIYKTADSSPTSSNAQKEPIYLPTELRSSGHNNTPTNSESDQSVFYEQDQEVMRDPVSNCMLANETAVCKLAKSDSSRPHDIQTDLYNKTKRLSNEPPINDAQFNRKDKRHIRSRGNFDTFNHRPHVKDPEYLRNRGVSERSSDTENMTLPAVKMTHDLTPKLSLTKSDPEYITLPAINNNPSSSTPMTQKKHVNLSDAEYKTLPIAKMTRGKPSKSTPATAKKTFDNSDSEYMTISEVKSTRGIPARFTKTKDLLTLSDSECVTLPPVNSTRGLPSISTPKTQEEHWPLSDTEPSTLPSVKMTRTISSRSTNTTPKYHLSISDTERVTSTPVKTISDIPLSSTPITPVNLPDSECITLPVAKTTQGLPSKYEYTPEALAFSDSEYITMPGVKTFRGIHSLSTTPKDHLTLSDIECVNSPPVKMNSQQSLKPTPKTSREYLTSSNSEYVTLRTVKTTREIHSRSTNSTPKDPLTLSPIANGGIDIDCRTKSKDPAFPNHNALRNSTKRKGHHKMNTLANERKRKVGEVMNDNQGHFYEHIDRDDILRNEHQSKPTKTRAKYNIDSDNVHIDDKRSAERYQNKKKVKSYGYRRSLKELDINNAMENKNVLNGNGRNRTKGANTDKENERKMLANDVTIPTDSIDKRVRKASIEGVAVNECRMSSHIENSPHASSIESARLANSHSTNTSYDYRSSPNAKNGVLQDNSNFSILGSEMLDSEGVENDPGIRIKKRTGKGVNVNMQHRFKDENNQFDSGVFVSYGESKSSVTDETDVEKQTVQNMKNNKEHNVQRSTKQIDPSQFGYKRLSTIESLASNNRFEHQTNSGNSDYSNEDQRMSEKKHCTKEYTGIVSQDESHKGQSTYCLSGSDDQNSLINYKSYEKEHATKYNFRSNTGSDPNDRAHYHDNAFKYSNQIKDNEAINEMNKSDEFQIKSVSREEHAKSSNCTKNPHQPDNLTNNTISRKRHKKKRGDKFQREKGYNKKSLENENDDLPSEFKDCISGTSAGGEEVKKHTKQKQLGPHEKDQLKNTCEMDDNVHLDENTGPYLMYTETEEYDMHYDHDHNRSVFLNPERGFEKTRCKLDFNEVESYMKTSNIMDENVRYKSNDAEGLTMNESFVFSYENRTSKEDENDREINDIYQIGMHKDSGEEGIDDEDVDADNIDSDESVDENNADTKSLRIMHGNFEQTQHDIDDADTLAQITDRSQTTNNLGIKHYLSKTVAVNMNKRCGSRNISKTLVYNQNVNYEDDRTYSPEMSHAQQMRLHNGQHIGVGGNLPMKELFPSSNSVKEAKASDSFSNEQGSVDSDIVSDSHVSFYTKGIDSISKPISDRYDTPSGNGTITNKHSIRRHRDPKDNKARTQEPDETSDTGSEIQHSDSERRLRRDIPIIRRQDNLQFEESSDDDEYKESIDQHYDNGRTRMRRNMIKDDNIGEMDRSQEISDFENNIDKTDDEHEYAVIEDGRKRYRKPHAGHNVHSKEGNKNLRKERISGNVSSKPGVVARRGRRRYLAPQTNITDDTSTSDEGGEPVTRTKDERLHKIRGIDVDNDNNLGNTEDINQQRLRKNQGIDDGYDNLGNNQDQNNRKLHKRQAFNDGSESLGNNQDINHRILHRGQVIDGGYDDVGNNQDRKHRELHKSKGIDDGNANLGSNRDKNPRKSHRANGMDDGYKNIENTQDNKHRQLRRNDDEYDNTGNTEDKNHSARDVSINNEYYSVENDTSRHEEPYIYSESENEFDPSINRPSNFKQDSKERRYAPPESDKSLPVSDSQTQRRQLSRKNDNPTLTERGGNESELQQTDRKQVKTIKQQKSKLFSSNERDQGNKIVSGDSNTKMQLNNVSDRNQHDDDNVFLSENENVDETTGMRLHPSKKTSDGIPLIYKNGVFDSDSKGGAGHFKRMSNNSIQNAKGKGADKPLSETEANVNRASIVSEDQSIDYQSENKQHGRLHPSKSIRNISVDMSCLSPHLHMYDSSTPSDSPDDDDQLRNRNSTKDDFRNYRYRHMKYGVSPPLIDSSIAFDEKSLTSQEPELELTFDDVIDVENLEVKEEIDPASEKNQQEERRKRRHRHRKKRKLELTSQEEVEKCKQVGESRKAVDSVPDRSLNIKGEISDNNKGTIIVGENDIEGVGDDDEDFFKAVQMINDETKQFNHPSYKTGEKSNTGNKDNRQIGMNNSNVGVDDSKSNSLTKRKQGETLSKGKRMNRAGKMPFDETKTHDLLKRPEVKNGLGVSKDDNLGNDPKFVPTNTFSDMEDLHPPFEHETYDERNEEGDITEGKTHRIYRNASKGSNAHSADIPNDYVAEGGNSVGVPHMKENSRIQEENSEYPRNKGTRSKKHYRNNENEFYNQSELQKGDAVEIDNAMGALGTKPSEDTKKHNKKKGGKNKRKYKDFEIDFSDLPSIQSQISKIMEGYNYDDQANTHRSRSSTRRSISRGSGIFGRRQSDIATLRMYRSKSEQKGLTIANARVRKKRSQSLPHATDLMSMKETLDTGDADDAERGVTVPVYLGSFPMSIAKKQFKQDRKRVAGRQRRLSTSTLEEDGTNKSELEPLREESQVIEPVEMDRVLTPSLTRIPTPASTNILHDNGYLSNTNSNHSDRVTKPLSTVGEGHVTSLNEDISRLSGSSLYPQTEEKPKTPVKREIVKKEKKPKTPLPVRPKSLTPEPEPTPVSPSPEPIEDEEPVSREISFVFNRDLPELPPIEVPDLPDIPEAQQKEYKGIKREKKLIEVTPELPAQKKKFPPPPKRRPQIKTRAPSRKSKVAEAPVTTQELQQMVDPLDFLAKYCIINPDRLPFYERVFNGALSVQTPRYSRATEAPKGAIVHLPPAQLSDHELNILKDITVLNQGHCPRNDGLSAPEQYLEKLNYSIEFTKSKQDIIQRHMEKMQAEKMSYMASMAKLWDRDIARVDYKTKSKKKKKKKKKKKEGEEPDYDQMGALHNKTNFQPMKASDITDEVIVSRMDDKMMKKIKKDPTYLKCKMELGRDIEKLKHYDQRIAQIEDEKDLVGLYCMDYYFSEQSAMSRPHEFRRQQSRLYQKLHPDTDEEMNVDEVEPALQQINNKLLTEREFQYIYFILDLPKREKINFRLFTIIAALSEKVTQMDPAIRKLINKVDYNALDVKLEKSKELFQLLQDEHVLPQGKAPSDNLAVELTAGGLTPEHTNYVMNKFDREGRGFIDFLDFVTYVPLFIDIHQRIVEDPFNQTLCV